MDTPESKEELKALAQHQRTFINIGKSPSLIPKAAEFNQQVQQKIHKGPMGYH